MSDREQQISNFMGRCVHFTGLWGPGMVKHDACKAGVRYDDVCKFHDPIPYVGRDGGNYSAGRSFPCHSGPGMNVTGVTCLKRATPTRAEAEAHVAEGDAMIARYFKARTAITDDGRSEGEVACPNCASGRLAFVKASNGHVHAKCSTEGCCSWME